MYRNYGYGMGPTRVLSKILVIRVGREVRLKHTEQATMEVSISSRPILFERCVISVAYSDLRNCQTLCSLVENLVFI